MDLLKRRQEILDQNVAAEKTRGSGWHLADPGAEQRERNNEPPLSQRPVILQDNDRIHVVGPCVATVQTGLQRFLDKLEAAKKRATERGWDEPDLLTHGIKYQAQVARLVRKVMAQADHIDLPTQEWNYVNSALGHVGVLVVSAVAEVQSYDDL